MFEHLQWNVTDVERIFRRFVLKSRFSHADFLGVGDV
jgi:hypothetical protein